MERINQLLHFWYNSIIFSFSYIIFKKFLNCLQNLYVLPLRVNLLSIISKKFINFKSYIKLVWQKCEGLMNYENIVNMNYHYANSVIKIS